MEISFNDKQVCELKSIINAAMQAYKQAHENAVMLLRLRPDSGVDPHFWDECLEKARKLYDHVEEAAGWKKC